jgi:glycosyltransferase involved in cell wall biosynthesis
MKIKLWLLTFLTLLSLQNFLFSHETYLEEKPMTIVLRSYNNKEWYKRNLDSILSQKYQNFRVLYYDDASTDNTGPLVEEYLQKKDLDHRVTLFQNPIRRCSMANLYHGVWLCHGDEIIIDMDGDDWFAHDHVLSHLNEVYADPSVWLTYGSHVTYPDYKIGIAGQVPQHIIDQNTSRENGGWISHLRTYYAGLFQKIKKEDMYYEGDFVKSAQDVAYMVPMFEMGGKHSKFIAEILYVYNRANPINDDKVDRALQWKIDQYIRSKEKYSPIEER